VECAIEEVKERVIEIRSVLRDLIPATPNAASARKVVA
jgi:hypothetical protein